MRTIGTPGGEAFAYLAADAAGEQVIVYAKTMSDAILVYVSHQYRWLEPHSIRQMSDNE